jgi:glycosyltransferase involved in cell wall biosynthesis
VADDAHTTAQQIAKLLTDARLREELGRAGRRFVEERYSWSHALERVRSIEQNLHQRQDPAAV